MSAIGFSKEPSPSVSVESVEDSMDSLEIARIPGVAQQVLAQMPLEGDHSGVKHSIDRTSVQGLPNGHEGVERAVTRTRVLHKHSTISTRQWELPIALRFPPYPLKLKKFLAGDCTIWPGYKRKQTHIVVPLFSQVSINDASPIPFTLASLNQLDKSAGGPGIDLIMMDLIPPNICAEQGFGWAVLTRNIIPGSEEKSYQEQISLLPEGYEAPGLLDAARAILWENQLSGWKWGNTVIRCKETCDDYHHWAIGMFTSLGIGIGPALQDSPSLGIAGWKKF